MRFKFAHYLFGIYLILSIVLAISPYDRMTWFIENFVIWVLVGGLVLTYRKFKFSNWSYSFMFIFVVLHTIGGHYTFENVPFSFITDMFGFERNMFDRLAHFCVGFFAYPIAELLLRSKKVKSRAVILMFSAFAIIAWAGFYEIMEWIYAVVSNPELGAAFLGSQGDIWDAQKDILMDSLGALFATLIFWLKNRSKLNFPI